MSGITKIINALVILLQRSGANILPLVFDIFALKDSISMIIIKHTTGHVD